MTDPHPKDMIRMCLRHVGSVDRLPTLSAPSVLSASGAVSREVHTHPVSSDTYKAAMLTEVGKPLEIQHVPRISEVPDGHVRVAIHCAGVNFADILMAQGKYQEKPPLPFTPGSEWAGVVMETGPDVTSLKAGDRVFGLSPASGGSFAQEGIFNSYMALPLPGNVPFHHAAGFIISYATAYGALSRKARLQEGETVLVTAAAGATGLACVDLATNVFKCKVIAACGSDEKCAVARSRGAHETINYTREDVRARVREITEGEGANVVVDMVGGQLWQQCVRSIAFEGRLIVIGFASGDIPKMATNALLLKSASAVGFYWGNYGMRGHPFFLQSVQHVTSLLAQGRISPHVTDVFPLEQVNEAFQFVADRKSKGKVVLKMRD